jgi:integrase
VLAYGLSSDQYGLLIVFLIATGQRLAQVANLRAEWIRQAERTISWEGKWMKSGKGHSIPYSDFTANLLSKLPTEGLLFRTEKGESFNNWSNAHAAFLKGVGVSHFTRHDCRRVFSTVHARCGTPSHLVERLLLDHTTSTTQSMVARIYNRPAYEPELKAAAETYERHLHMLLKS